MGVDSGDERPILQVYEAGKLTVLGFGGQTLLDQVDLSVCRREITELVEEHKCETLAFDLAGVAVVPSGLLGLLASLRDLGVEVLLYDPSEDIREVLEVTQLSKIIGIHETDSDTSTESDASSD